MHFQSNSFHEATKKWWWTHSSNFSMLEQGVMPTHRSSLKSSLISRVILWFKLKTEPENSSCLLFFRLSSLHSSQKRITSLHPAAPRAASERPCQDNHHHNRVRRSPGSPIGEAGSPGSLWLLAELQSFSWIWPGRNLFVWVQFLGQAGGAGRGGGQL